jgi:hypothetical protein
LRSGIAEASIRGRPSTHGCPRKRGPAQPHDLPGADQVSADGSTVGDKQGSPIFSIDALHDLKSNCEIGGKLAYRSGETTPRTKDTFTGNDAGLIARRATSALGHKSELSGEARMLILPDSDPRRTGVLPTVCNSFGNRAKPGLGYNFGRFADDLCDTTQDDKGLFLNLQAKFRGRAPMFRRERQNGRPPGQACAERQTSLLVCTSHGVGVARRWMTRR